MILINYKNIFSIDKKLQICKQIKVGDLLKVPFD